MFYYSLEATTNVLPGYGLLLFLRETKSVLMEVTMVHRVGHQVPEVYLVYQELIYLIKKNALDKCSHVFLWGWKLKQ